MMAAMEWHYSFPNRENRNRFLSIIAMNVGEYGIGLGLEFVGLEYALERADAHGRLISHIGDRAAGEWRLAGSDVVIELGMIAVARDNLDRLRKTLAEQAANFGAPVSIA
jgi:hypothetical protein